MKNSRFYIVCFLIFAFMVSCEKNTFDMTSTSNADNEIDSFDVPPICGDWPDVCSIHFGENISSYTFTVGDEVDRLPISCIRNSDLYTGMADYSIDVVTEDDTIMKIVSFDKEKLMDGEIGDGITVACLKVGTTRIRLTMTYLPTGGTYTTYATVTVVAPSSTQSAETTD